eukprot:TRINITY_DN1377_c2_g2_i1.p1 TRINITY_DN1377_c2_g2~~TRINITY_DN1377_c2_g2_i1.p1  ORF type:complete len:188 (-),score=94.67 TRINITY_DN1377_c2_g2_i1:51-614(-)
MGCATSQPEYADEFELPVSISTSAPRRSRQQLLDILKHPTLSLLFREYLRSIYSLENLSFFMAVEDYRELREENEMRKRAEEIFQNFFSPDSEQEVDIEGSLKEMLKESIKRPDRETFDLVQQLVLVTLEGDCLPKFLNWELFHEFSQDPITRKTFLAGLPRSPSVSQITAYVSRQAEKSAITITPV